MDEFISGGAGTAVEAVGGFENFPLWMWRNQPTVELIEWLRDWNAQHPDRPRVRLFGLDLYSLMASAGRVDSLITGPHCVKP